MIKKIEEFLIKNRFVIVLFLFIFSYLILVFPSLFVTTSQELKPWERFIRTFAFGSFKTWLLCITFVAVVWYTLETAKLREETSELKDITKWGIELSNRPWLTVNFFWKGKQVNEEIYISNIGKGLAVNVELKILDKTDFKSIKAIDFMAVEKNHNVRDVLSKYITGVDGNFQLKLEYSDINKRKYFSCYDLSDNRVKLKSHGVLQKI